MNSGMSDEPKNQWAWTRRVLLAVFALYALSVGPVYHLAPWLLPLYGPLDWMPGLQWYLTLWGANL
jgi:hypothetical protein